MLRLCCSTIAGGSTLAAITIRSIVRYRMAIFRYMRQTICLVTDWYPEVPAVLRSIELGAAAAISETWDTVSIL